MAKHETYIDKNKWKKERLKTIVKKAIILVLLIFASNFIIDKTFHYNFLSNTMKAIVGLVDKAEDVPSIELESDGWADKVDGSWHITKTSTWGGIGEAQIEIDVETIAKTAETNKDIVLVLDNSYSMRGTKIENLKKNTKELINTILNEGNNKIAIINFNKMANILSDFSDDINFLTQQIDNMPTTGKTNYNAALKCVDNILENYVPKGNRDLVVLFLSDGYPCEDTPNQIATYEVLKEKYPFMALNAVQYEMGNTIQPELIEISDKQYLATEENLGIVLYEAIISPNSYEEFTITDVINGEDFYIDTKNDIETSIGKVSLAKEAGKQTVTWDLGGNTFKTGSTAKMIIKLKIVSKYLSNHSTESLSYFEHEYGKTYQTNLSTEANVKFADEDEETKKTEESPMLPAVFQVIYRDNCVSDWFWWDDAGTIVEYYVNTPVKFIEGGGMCGTLEFAGWGIRTDGVKKVNNDTFIMPSKNVEIYAIYKDKTITKRLDGNVFSYQNPNDKLLYDVIKKAAINNRKAKKYEGEGFDGFTNDIYYYDYSNENGRSGTGPDNNYVMFGGLCWRMMRTTETGGVKIMYYGDDCNNQNYIVGNFNNQSNSLSYAGYMYNKVYDSQLASFISNKVILYDSYTIDNNEYHGFLVSNNINYDRETGKYNLESTYYVSNSSYYMNSNFYTCLSYTEESCDEVYYVVSTKRGNYNSGDYKYYYEYTFNMIKLTGGNDINYYNKEILMGSSYIKNEDGTYNLTNLNSKNLLNWDGRTRSYICEDVSKSENCSNIFKISNSDEKSYSYYKKDILYGNDAEYNTQTGLYTLKDTDSFQNIDIDLNKYHYTCGNEETTCKELKVLHNYSYESSNGNYYYYFITLKNGKTIEDAINEMLYADDVNVYDSDAKKTLEQWYEDNLLDYNDYIEDTIFCNDRSIASIGGWDKNSKLSDYFDFVNYSDDDKEISLLCQRETDSFSLSNSKAKLNYPIGLMANNETSLMKASIYYREFLITPDYFSNKIHMSPGNDPNLQDNHFSPVISLKKGTEYISGNGTKANPYIIKTN